jgi:hypothetical protein
MDLKLIYCPKRTKGENLTYSLFFLENKSLAVYEGCPTSMNIKNGIVR